MNAAVTLRWPARMNTGSVRTGKSLRPWKSMSPPYRSKATRSPSMDTSMSWKRSPHPDMNPMEKAYSPSAGKVWSTLIPPRVPKGAPSTASHSCWDTDGGFE